MTAYLLLRRRDAAYHRSVISHEQMKKAVQIGQCRIYVEESETNTFYLEQPLITKNCKCENCNYFASEVIQRDTKLFNNLKAMGVLLGRQPNINPDGVSCVGDTEKFKKGYLGNYRIFGTFGKTQKEPQLKDDEGNLKSERFEETGDEFYCSYEIVKMSETELDFQFWIEIDRKNEH